MGVLCNGIAAAENWKFSFNGYSDKTCKIKSSGKVLTFPLDTCTKNVYGQMSIFTCQKPGVILEKMYTDDNCTKIERDFSIENNGCFSKVTQDPKTGKNTTTYRGSVWTGVCVCGHNRKLTGVSGVT